MWSVNVATSSVLDHLIEQEIYDTYNFPVVLKLSFHQLSYVSYINCKNMKMLTVSCCPVCPGQKCLNLLELPYLTGDILYQLRSQEMFGGNSLCAFKVTRDFFFMCVYLPMREELWWQPKIAAGKENMNWLW
jgi:hypothetical protein